MKLRILLPALLLALSMNVFGQACPITQDFIDDYTERITQNTRLYFDALANLVDKDYSYEDKAAISRSVDELFLNKSVVIENDIEKLATERYKVAEYLANLSNAYSNEIVEITPEIKAVSKIYYDELYDNYLMKVDVDRVLTELRKEDDDKGHVKVKQLQIYFSFKACDKVKIMSIQLAKTKANPFEGKKEVIPVSKEEAERTLKTSKPYIEFDIYPAGAEIMMDSVAVPVVRGQKVETTPGVRTLTISAPNYETQTMSLGVGDTGVTLVKKTLSLKTGTITILPSDNRFIGANAILLTKQKGKRRVPIGSIPLNNYVLPYGFYKVKLTQYCRIEKVYKVALTEAKPTQNVTVTLASAAAINNGVQAIGSMFNVNVPNPCATVK